MGILYTTACALSLLHPQGPGTGPAFELADLLPKESLIAVGVNSCAPHEAAIRETGLFQIIERVMDEADVGSQIQLGLMQLEMVTGLTTDQLRAALSNGMAFSWTGLDKNDKPDWVAIVNLGDSSDAIGKTVERLVEMAKTQASVRSDLWDNTLVHKIRSEDGMELAVTVHQELLVLASGQPELEGVLRRRDQHGQASLLQHPEFKGISQDLSQTGQPLMGVFVQPAEIVNLVVRKLPPEARGPVRSALKSLELDSVTAAGYAMHARRGEFHDYLRVVYPEPRSGLLATLLTGSGDIDRKLSRLIPPDVTGYSLVSMSVPHILEQILEVAGSVDPMTGNVVNGLLANLTKESGVDLREDLLSTVGEQILSLQWASGGELLGQDMAIVVNLHDALQFQNNWDILQPMVPMPIKARDVQGHRIYQYPVPDTDQSTWPIMTVADDSLVFATGETPFKAVLSQIDRPVANSDAQTLIANLPQGTFIVSWLDVAKSIRSQLGMLSAVDGFDETNPTFQALLKALDEHGGSMRTTARADERGVEFRARSPIGNAQAIALVSIAAAVAIPNMLAASTDPNFGSATEIRWDPAMTELMGQVSAAQQEYRRLNGEYGTFPDLVNQGILPPAVLGDAMDNGFFHRDGHLIALFIPTNDVGRENHYVAVAWPEDKRIGLVYGSIPGRPVMANDVIAAAIGIQQIDPRDIFVGGSFSEGLVAGWRDLTPRTDNTPDPVGSGPGVRKGEDVRDLHRAEKEADQAELTRLLQSRDPEVAARAAYVLGNLNAKSAVPELCDAVTNRTDLQVRLQAMSALNKIRDPRSQKASTAALASESVLLRALAASNLGKLREASSVPPLLNLISGPNKDDDDTRDQVQALLALNDIGRPECLLPAAAAETSEREEVDEALTYLFQSLSPKLPPEEEVSSLMAVLDHRSAMLRRYSIQRLGELRDKTAVRALEGRLAVEGESLSPLIQVSLDSIRGTEAATPATDVLTRVKTEADKLWGETKVVWGKAKVRWEKLTDQERLIAEVCAGGFLVVLVVLMIWRSRRRRAVRGEAMAAMVAPSEGLEPLHEEHFEEQTDEYMAGEETTEGAEGLFDDEFAEAEAMPEYPAGVAPSPDLQTDDDDWLPAEDSEETH